MPGGRVSYLSQRLNVVKTSGNRIHLTTSNKSETNKSVNFVMQYKMIRFANELSVYLIQRMVE